MKTFEQIYESQDYEDEIYTCEECMRRATQVIEYKPGFYIHLCDKHFEEYMRKK